MPIKQNFNTEGITPVPDPSILTTQNLLREIAGLRELLSQRVESIEKAVSVAHENLVRVPTDTDRAIGHLGEVINEQFETVNERFKTVAERFSGIATQFVERDTRVEQSATKGDQALSAALQAAKELVGNQNASFVASIAKSDAATKEQFASLVLTITTGAQATNDKIDDLKGRLTLIEGQARGVSTAVVAQHATTFNSANIWGIVLGIIGTVALVGSFIMATGVHH